MPKSDEFRCTYPRCACKATGVFCSKRPVSGSKKKKFINQVSAKQALKKVEKQHLIQNDAAFYFVIWQEREHKCQNCGARLFTFSLLLFHHILPKREKGGFPQYRHCKWNIWLLCWQCHDTHDNGNPDSKIVKPLRTEYERLKTLHETGKLSDVERNKNLHSI